MGDIYLTDLLSAYCTLQTKHLSTTWGVYLSASLPANQNLPTTWEVSDRSSQHTLQQACSCKPAPLGGVHYLTDPCIFLHTAPSLLLQTSTSLQHGRYVSDGRLTHPASTAVCTRTAPLQTSTSLQHGRYVSDGRLTHPASTAVCTRTAPLQTGTSLQHGRYVSDGRLTQQASTAVCKRTAPLQTSTSLQHGRYVSDGRLTQQASTAVYTRTAPLQTGTSLQHGRFI